MLIKKIGLMLLLMVIVAGLAGCRGPKPEPKSGDDYPPADQGGGRAVTPGQLNDPSPSGGVPPPVRDTGRGHYNPGNRAYTPGATTQPGNVEIEVFHMGRKLNLDEPFSVIDTMETTLNIYLTASGSDLRSYSIWGSGPGAPRVNQNVTGAQAMFQYTFTYDSRTWSPDGITITVTNQNYQNFNEVILLRSAQFVPTG